MCESLFVFHLDRVFARLETSTNQEGQELEQLNLCASLVLAKLDDCKADDLACECCALQSLSRNCYGLCPGSPSGSFLSVLYDDCEALNDVNACGLPFKKSDGHPPQKLTKKEAVKGSKSPDVVVKSTFGGERNDTNTTAQAAQNQSLPLNSTTIEKSEKSGSGKLGKIKSKVKEKIKYSNEAQKIKYWKEWGFALGFFFLI